LPGNRIDFTSCGSTTTSNSAAVRFNNYKFSHVANYFHRAKTNAINFTRFVN
jgi:hypothetical protein